MNLYVPEIAEESWGALAQLQDAGIPLNPRALVLAQSLIDIAEFAPGEPSYSQMVCLTKDAAVLISGITQRPSDDIILESVGGSQGVLGGGPVRRQYLDGAFRSTSVWKWLPAVGMDMVRAARLMMYGTDADIVSTMDVYRKRILLDKAEWVEGEFPQKIFSVTKSGRPTIATEKAAVKFGLHLTGLPSYRRAFEAAFTNGAEKVRPTWMREFGLWQDKQCFHYDDVDAARKAIAKIPPGRDVLVFDNTETSDMGLCDSPYDSWQRWITPHSEDGFMSFDPWYGVDNMPVPVEIIALNVNQRMYSTVFTVGKPLRFVKYE